MSRNDLLLAVAQEYAKRNRVLLGEQLGYGIHGIVLAGKRQDKGGKVAIKVHEHPAAYLRERDVYQRLLAHSVRQILDCSIPRLVAYDDELHVLEMTMVDRPFVLDFGGAYLDRPPDFSEEVLADWRAAKQEEF